MVGWSHWGMFPIEQSFEKELVFWEDLQDAENYVVEWLNLKLANGVVSRCLIRQLALARCRLPSLEFAPGLLVDFHEVCEQIGRLEASGQGNGRPTPTVKEKQFSSGHALAGLWHKHWWQSTFMIRNLSNELESENLKYIDRRMRSIYGVPISRAPMDDEKFAGIVAYAAVWDTMLGRMGGSTSRLTGEWIVVARMGGRNYYLTLGLHREPKDIILLRCRSSLKALPELQTVECLAAHLTENGA